MAVSFVTHTGPGPVSHRFVIEISIGDTDPRLYLEYLSLAIIACLKQANKQKHNNDFEQVYELLSALIPDEESVLFYQQKGEQPCQ